MGEEELCGGGRTKTAGGGNAWVVGKGGDLLLLGRWRWSDDEGSTEDGHLGSGRRRGTEVVALGGEAASGEAQWRCGERWAAMALCGWERGRDPSEKEKEGSRRGRIVKGISSVGSSRSKG
ncbi:Os03g0278650 [Oryza sativa Japonica Group]|uniref:Os03g0278650 protein n=1 Tax=Oryza sativa subsp. japonica TaxID=39947 RepID=A0A0P0VW57_ORYSJ|nr:Os03g0278650 [Oryza sativa Japonica Group]